MRSQPNKIHFDIDDVLSELTPYVLHKLGAKIEPWDYEAYPAGYGWDFVGAANALIPGAEFTSSTFWAAVAPLWPSVPRAPLALDLLDMAADFVGRENVRLISTIVPGSANGKEIWIRKNLPTWIHGQVHLVSGHIKGDCAGPGQLLVDDANHNIDAWLECGGDTLQWSRPWNTAPRLTWPQISNELAAWNNKYKTELCGV